MNFSSSDKVTSVTQFTYLHLHERNTGCLYSSYVVTTCHFVTKWLFLRGLGHK